MRPKKKTLVIGASIKKERYSNKAIRLLRQHNHPVEAIGIREGEIGDVKFKTGIPPLSDVNTVTLYIRPQRQHIYYNYIEELKPKRVIFNPGTENDELIRILSAKGVEVIENCTLVMLNSELF